MHFVLVCNFCMLILFVSVGKKPSHLELIFEVIFFLGVDVADAVYAVQITASCPNQRTATIYIISLTWLLSNVLVSVLLTFSDGRRMCLVFLPPLPTPLPNVWLHPFLLHVLHSLAFRDNSELVAPSAECSYNTVSTSQLWRFAFMFSLIYFGCD